MLSLKKTLCFCTILLALYACSRVPDHIIPPDDMAKVMADINEGESYIETNYSDFATDSSRMALKQSILAKYGYDLADLDTSFMWYGANLKVYDQVCEDAIKILEERLAASDAVAAASATVAVAGDSVDVWSGARGFVVNMLSPANMMAFDLKRDNNWQMGDQYTWRVKLLNNRKDGSFTIATDYVDGVTEYMTSRFGGDGWQEMTFYVDSTRTAKRIYGVLKLQATEASSIYLDSMQLVRNRLNPKKYSQRYRQRTYTLPQED